MTSQQKQPSSDTKFSAVREAIGLEKNVVAVSLAVLLLGAGQELWNPFMPKYLEALGASAAAIGLFGTARDFLDGLYQYPGGWLSDRIGTRGALILFAVLAMAGYTIYALSPVWPLVFVGLAFVMAWSSMGSPAIFALIGERLPRERRAMGFTVQAILKRAPVLISPALGGLLISRLGIERGVRFALAITIALTGAAIIAQRRMYSARLPVEEQSPVKMFAQFAGLHPALKRLLISDIFIRTCEGMTGVFVVLYVLNVVGATAVRFGVLTGVQVASSIIAYIPAARLADRLGRKPFVTATFLCFSAFPAAIALSQSTAALVLAFMIGGLRELGEPARKAMIVDLAEPTRRGRTVGLYYLSRSLAITPAALIGGLLWRVNPALPFFVACATGLMGTAIFVLTVDRRYAS